MNSKFVYKINPLKSFENQDVRRDIRPPYMLVTDKKCLCFAKIGDLGPIAPDLPLAYT